MLFFSVGETPLCISGKPSIQVHFGENHVKEQNSEWELWRSNHCFFCHSWNQCNERYRYKYDPLFDGAAAHNSNNRVSSRMGNIITDHHAELRINTIRYAVEVGSEWVLYSIHNHFTAEYFCPSDQERVPTRRVQEHNAEKNGELKTLHTIRSSDLKHFLDFIAIEHTYFQFHEIVRDYYQCIFLCVDIEVQGERPKKLQICMKWRV